MKFLNSIYWRKIILVMFIALLLRFYKITNPLTDAYHARQTQTAMVTRNILRDNFKFWMTRLDVFGPNPGYIILEFPIINIITAFIYLFTGINEIVGRIIAVIFSISAIPFIYLFGKNILNERIAFFATLIYTFLPASIYFGRTFMPEAPLMFFSISSIYFVYKWLDKKRKRDFLYATIFTAFCYLAKATSLFYMSFLFFCLFLIKEKKFWKQKNFYLFFILSLFPIFLWTIHSDKVNRTYNVGHTWDNLWLYGSLQLRLSKHFYLTLADHIFKAILTPIGSLLFILGMLLKPKNKSEYILHLWVIFVFLSFFILAGGQGHYYYQLPLILPAIFFISKSINFAITPELRDFWGKYIDFKIFKIIILFLFIAYLILYWIFFSDAYDISKRIPYHLEAARIISKFTPSDAIILVADFQNSLPTDLLYYADRKGWGISFDKPTDEIIQELENKIKQGANYLAVVSSYRHSLKEFYYKDDLYWQIKRKFKTLRIGKGYHIFVLQ